MARYRKKPVVIEAFQTNTPTEIETLEGTMRADAGDWIITGVKGETYPCKPDIFEATYDPYAEAEVERPVLDQWLADHLGRSVQLVNRGGQFLLGTLRRFDTEHVVVANDSGQLSCARIQDLWLFNEASKVLPAPDGALPRPRGLRP